MQRELLVRLIEKIHWNIWNFSMHFSFIDFSTNVFFVCRFFNDFSVFSMYLFFSVVFWNNANYSVAELTHYFLVNLWNSHAYDEFSHNFRRQRPTTSPKFFDNFFLCLEQKLQLWLNKIGRKRVDLFGIKKSARTSFFPYLF